MYKMTTFTATNWSIMNFECSPLFTVGRFSLNNEIWSGFIVYLNFYKNMYIAKEGSMSSLVEQKSKEPSFLK